MKQMVATDGIEGTAVIDPSYPYARRWTVVKSGNSLILECVRPGLLMFVR